MMAVPARLVSSGTFAYVAVKGSLHAADSAVFGLNEIETEALVNRFNCYRNDVVNGVLLKGTPLQVVNALSQLRYRVVATTGETEIVFTMEREL